MSSDDTPRVVEGKVSFAESGTPAEKVVVQVKDADLLVDDPIGSATTDADGHFRIEYDLSAYVNEFLEPVDRIIERAPDIYVEVRDRTGALLGSTEDDVLYEADSAERIVVELPGEGPLTTRSRERRRADRSTGDIPDDPDSDIEPVAESDFIKFVKFDTQNPAAGESISVQPVLDDATVQPETRVAINGVPGASQTLQFSEPGEKLITVSAFRLEDGRPTSVDHQTVEVEVDEPPEADSPRYFQPILQARQVIWDGLSVEFTVENADEYGGESPDYRWIVGDREIVTGSPTLRYDFEDELQPGSPYETFDVSVEMSAETTRTSQQGSRTVSVWNRDYINRTQGTVELRSVGEPNLVQEEDRYAIPYELHNPGPTHVEIDTRQVEFLLTNDTDAEPLLAPEDVSFLIPAESSVTRKFSIPVSDVPPDPIGIGLHFFGRTEPELEVYGNAYAEVAHNHPLAQPVIDPDLSPALANVFAMEPEGGYGTSIPLPELLGEGANQVEKEDCSDTARSREISELSKSEILDALPDASPVSPAVNEDVVSDGGIIPEEIPDARSATAGDRCHPAQNHLRDDLTCKRTGEEEQVWIPGRILNARRGDVILSPGGGSVIARLLSHVSPIEVYSHSGIMTSDFLDIRHSTESYKWLKKQRSPLFDPEALTYGWPGAITQTVDEAYYGSNVPNAPDGNSYSISAFTNRMSDVAGMGIVRPEVVKPDPLKEYQFSDLRPTLQDVSKSAENLKAHYRYYEYSQARADSHVSHAGSQLSDTPWWDQSRPTVCSTFIWGAIKSLDDPPLLETDQQPLDSGDLETQDADLGSEPKDGLYHYTRSERKSAASWLHGWIKNKAQSQSGLFAAIGAVPNKLANAVTNSFASDLTGFKENGLVPKRMRKARSKERWEDPGPGQTVSPDGIRNYWDTPEKVGGELRGLYGHTETLVYRPADSKERPVYRWEKSQSQAQDATLEVTVVFEGKPLPNAELTGWGNTKMTDGNGKATLTLEPGSYSIRAKKVHDIGNHDWYLSDDFEIDLDPGETESRTLSVERPDEMFREVEVSGSMKLLDPNWPGKDVEKKHPFRTRVRLQPSRASAPSDKLSNRKLSWSHTIDKEVKGDLKVVLECQGDGSIDASVTTKLVESGEGLTTEDTKKSSKSKVIPKGKKRSFSDHHKIKDPVTDNPEIWTDVTIQNRQSRT